MDPIIAGGLVSAGKNLLDGISNQLASKKTVEAQGRVSFPDELGKASQEDASVRFSNSKSARLALMENPASIFLHGENANSQVYLEKRADGSIQLLSSSGETLILTKDSEACRQAINYFDLCLEEKSNLTEFRPNAVLFDA